MKCTTCTYDSSLTLPKGEFYKMKAFAERTESRGPVGVPLYVCPSCGNVQANLSEKQAFMDY